MPRRTNRTLTVVGLVLAFAMAALEATVVATAMPTTIGELGGIHLYAWVANAYLIASSVTVPIYGKLSDIYGRKPVMLFGLALFLVGSAASGAAQSMTQLIAFRALQGLGAGAMQPIALTIVGDIFDLEERSKMQGVFGAAWGIFGLTGPMLGGIIVNALSWRWVFYINIPFGIASAAMLIFALHERVEKKAHRVDLAGALLLTASVTALLTAANRVAPNATAITAIAGVILFAAFLAVERSAAEPILPLPLFARPVMAVSSLAGAIIGGAMMATMTYVPLYVQGVLHGAPTEAGGAITPMVVGWPIAAAISGRLIPKIGFRPLIVLGMGTTAVAGLGLALLPSYGVTLHGLQIVDAIFGVGMGLANTALIIAVQTSVTWEQRGVATASTMFFRTIGGAAAVAVIGGVINAALTADPSIPAGAASRLLTREGLRSIDPSVLQHLGAALTKGLGAAFWIVAGMAIVAFLTSLAFPRVNAADQARLSNFGGEGTQARASTEASARKPPA